MNLPYRKQAGQLGLQFFGQIIAFLASIGCVVLDDSWILVLVINGVTATSVVALVHANLFTLFGDSEPTNGVQSKEHATRSCCGPQCVHNHTIKLVSKELKVATVEYSGKVFARILGVGHKGHKNHTKASATQVNCGSIEGIINKENIFKEQDLRLTHNGAKGSHQNSCPWFIGIGTRACSALHKAVKNE